LQHLAGKTHIPSPYYSNFQTVTLTICPVFVSEFIVSKKKVGLIIIVSSMAHHTPTQM